VHVAIRQVAEQAPTEEHRIKRMWELAASYNATLRRWYSSLPDSVQDLQPTAANGDTFEPNVLVLHLIYHSILIKLNSQIAYSSTSISSYMLHERYIRDATDVCRDSAQQIATLAITHSLVLPYTGPFSGWSLWVAARTLFVHAILKHEPVPADLTRLVDIMRTTQPEWESARKYVRLLSNAMSKYESSNHGMPMNSASAPQVVSMLLDMRKTAAVVTAEGGTGGTATPTTLPTPWVFPDIFTDWMEHDQLFELGTFSQPPLSLDSRCYFTRL